ncbi:phosphonate ABC transporter, permease protein PhnE [Mesorhizobium sp.]|jgi:phosphonate transport system permease protein|uniref:phosphonate ABC transporter, permease protein PhnE n=1 Tax=Mesorhizobium sp. TaxID=1871066 RepID=UPI000FE3F060|nr:phosphonate ABC transporter, permease protein PhnE [Mesorhizobium sp.]RWH67990.1 MAG: phosphonate ABC transporter, permease protein PhnE [Mesorhizobium sp.]RWL21092.1 MAG: phosphonate ABC transporter, permease protein PhnE [Mesorhizobium sp.]RWL24962.1 MAG: phosphonate ABC transporter, permease protein PhnE [Mesorhizobium sp.]RWL29340.1 MAG: phosphonate ABC transporter, permease protein PhnE [Mesorhizobium sp.]RWL47044.1 MAG: phosphonate ABC transporter, permease protein PhnE [Mesorhizobium
MTFSTAFHSDTTRQQADAWRRQTSLRRFYTALGVGLLLVAMFATMWFADEANAGHFIDRLPHILDFLSWLVPKDWNDVWRALFDIASPSDKGTQEFNFPLGRVYIWDGFYIPEYFELMLTTVNVALVSTFIGFVFAVPFSFVAARNLTPNPVLRLVVKRFMELLRAFPEIVIAGLFAAIVSIGPVAAIIAIGLHSIGALGKLFYEINENIDMRPEEGLRAVGANWFERVRFADLPQVLPNFMSYTLLRIEINVRISTIMGAVGGGGIGEELKLAISRGFGAKTLALVLLLFITIFLVDQFSAWLRRKLVGEQAFLMSA